MIIPKFKRPRIKLFSRRTPIPENLTQEFLPNSSIENDYGKLKIRVEPSKNKWASDINKLSVTDKKRVDQLKKDIRNGHLFDDGEPDSDTHYLSDFSKTTGPNKSLLMSKYVNHSDRLNYRVYPPKLIINKKTGETEYVQKVVLESCRGHSRNGAKNYSDTAGW